ncbi:MAG: S41 family peptidase [Pseudobdellovibrio sp.]
MPIHNLLKRFLFISLSIVLTNGCQPPADGHKSSYESVRAMNDQEKTTDFDVLVNLFRANYGPLEYKQKVFNFNFENFVKSMRNELERAKSNAEIVSVYRKFITKFQDGHVSLSYGVGVGDSYYLPIQISSAGSSMYISELLDEKLKDTMNIEVGDEVLDIDGISKAQALAVIKKYMTYGSDRADQHLISYFSDRRDWMKEIVPQKPEAVVTLKKKNGDKIQRTLIWKKEEDRNEVKSTFVTSTKVNITDNAFVETAENSSFFGVPTPFFINDKTISKYGIQPAAVSKKTLTENKYNNGEKHEDIEAYIYRYNGKNILLVRQASYADDGYENALKYYKSLLQQYESMIDVLIIDQNYNPGGYRAYSTGFASLFAKQNTRGVVNYFKADRRWLNSFYSTVQALKKQKASDEEIARQELNYKTVENALNQGQSVAYVPSVLSGSGGTNILPYDKNWSFSKPILLLVNEMSGSGGDVFPMIMKANV